MNGDSLDQKISKKEKEIEEAGRLLAYWDATVKRRADQKLRVWQQLYEHRGILESH